MPTGARQAAGVAVLGLEACHRTVRAPVRVTRPAAETRLPRRHERPAPGWAGSASRVTVLLVEVGAVSTPRLRRRPRPNLKDRVQQQTNNKNTEQQHDRSYQSHPTGGPTLTVKGAKPCCIRQSKIPGVAPDTPEGGRAPPGTCAGCFFFFLVFFFEDEDVDRAPCVDVAPGRGGGGGGTARVEDSPEQEAQASQSHRLVEAGARSEEGANLWSRGLNQEAQARCGSQSRVARHGIGAQNDQDCLGQAQREGPFSSIPERK